MAREAARARSEHENSPHHTRCARHRSGRGRRAAAERQPSRFLPAARLSRKRARDDCGSDRRASRPAGLPLWPDRVHRLVPGRGRTRRHDRRNSPGCRGLLPGPPNLSTGVFQHSGARLRRCECRRQGSRLRPGRARCRLPDPRRPAPGDCRRRIRSARRALPPAGERRARRRRLARATARHGACDHARSNWRRVGRLRVWHVRRNHLVSADRPRNQACAPPALRVGGARRRRGRVPARPIAAGARRLHADRSQGQRGDRFLGAARGQLSGRGRRAAQLPSRRVQHEPATGRGTRAPSRPRAAPGRRSGLRQRPHRRERRLVGSAEEGNHVPARLQLEPVCPRHPVRQGPGRPAELPSPLHVHARAGRRRPLRRRGQRVTDCHTPALPASHRSGGG